MNINKMREVNSYVPCQSFISATYLARKFTLCLFPKFCYTENVKAGDPKYSGNKRSKKRWNEGFRSNGTGIFYLSPSFRMKKN